jgi:anaerobic selenocysteine-containing dehydrogenase
MTTATTHKTACNLCFVNCGLEVTLGGDDGRQFVKVKGDPDHPKSQGYICNKAARLNFYQNANNRITTPKKRMPDGSYADISWDQATQEIAARLKAVQEEFGGERILFYGGGGQGNHLGATYVTSLLNAVGVRYKGNPASQEKTGHTFAFSQMFGLPVHADIDNAQVVMFSGKNPFMSNGMDQARTFLREIKKDPNRTLIVLDPRRTETTDYADIHLAITPGRDAWCLSAILADVVQNHSLPMDWLEQHADGYQQIIERFSQIDVAAYADHCGVPVDTIRAAATAIAEASSFALEEDLGVQMAPHSTLNSYLDLLLSAMTGHFGRPGTMGPVLQIAEALPTDHTPLDDDGNLLVAEHLPVTGAPVISGLYPGAVLADEIDTDHPDRPRAMILESTNIVHSLPESDRLARGLRNMEFTMAVDVVMTETALQCDYVLPAASQYEKWEATYFHRHYPKNMFHLRRPFLEPAGESLPEAEIYARIIEQLGVVDSQAIEQLAAAAQADPDNYGVQLMTLLSEQPALKGLMSYVLYRTLGKTLEPDQDVAAALWGLCQRFAMMHPVEVARAGFEGPSAGNDIFKALCNSPSGVVISIADHAEAFSKLPKPRNKIQLPIGALLRDIDELDQLQPPVPVPEGFPMLLVAGQRRSYTANCIMRNPDWIKGKGQVELTINPQDAQVLGLEELSAAVLETENGRCEVSVSLDERMPQGLMALPNGQGMDHVNDEGEVVQAGYWINKVTSAKLVDKHIGTPLHKHVPARLVGVG